MERAVLGSYWLVVYDDVVSTFRVVWWPTCGVAAHNGFVTTSSVWRQGCEFALGGLVHRCGGIMEVEGVLVVGLLDCCPPARVPSYRSVLKALDVALRGFPLFMAGIYSKTVVGSLGVVSRRSTGIDHGTDVDSSCHGLSTQIPLPTKG